MGAKHQFPYQKSLTEDLLPEAPETVQSAKVKDGEPPLLSLS